MKNMESSDLHLVCHFSDNRIGNRLSFDEFRLHLVPTGLGLHPWMRRLVLSIPLCSSLSISNVNTKRNLDKYSVHTSIAYNIS